ncbi:aspartate/glutamate racemase family protein [Leptospira interrogans]
MGQRQPKQGDMKVIGIIGGMSAESTVLYYARLNAETRRLLGGLHSAKVVLWSVDFAEVEQMQSQGRWDDAGRLLAATAADLERAGAEIIVLATNTMHKVAPAIEAAVSIPFLHVADATADKIRASGLRRPALIGTRYTMEEDFYIGRLRDRFGIEVLVPNSAERAEINRIIFDELCLGITQETSRLRYIVIAERLKAAGADSLILGCTEVGMLLNATNVPMPVFDTTLIHVDAALEWALRAG